MSDSTTTLVTKKTVVTDLRIEAEPHYSVLRCWHVHATNAERVECHAKSAERWAKDFMEFLRDHRSQDLTGLNVVRVKEDVCSACGEKWETMAGDAQDGEQGKTFCASCGREAKP